MKNLFIACLVIAAFGLSAAAKVRPAAIQVSVSSRIAPEYQRKILPNGLPEKELYAISNGGLARGTMLDSTVEKISFPVIAGIVAEHLGKQNYFLSPDSKSAQLLLVIQWGRTIPFNGLNYSNAVNAVGSTMSARKFEQQPGVRPAGSPDLIGQSSLLEGDLMLILMEERWRYLLNEQNARLLGYMDAINDADGISRFAGGGGDRFRELFEDIEEPRYYVLVKAYEFRAAVEKREPKLLWITRISVATRGRNFDESVRPMIARASPYFGHQTERLIRDFNVKVEMGETSVIETNAALSESKDRRGAKPKKSSK